MSEVDGIDGIGYRMQTDARADERRHNIGRQRAQRDDVAEERGQMGDVPGNDLPRGPP